MRLGGESPSVTQFARFRGLKETGRYRVNVRHDIAEPRMFHATRPTWIGEDCEMSGAALAAVGLPMSALAPGQAELIHLTLLDEV